MLGRVVLPEGVEGGADGCMIGESCVGGLGVAGDGTVSEKGLLAPMWVERSFWCMLFVCLCFCVEGDQEKLMHFLCGCGAVVFGGERGLGMSGVHGAGIVLERIVSCDGFGVCGAGMHCCGRGVCGVCSKEGLFSGVCLWFELLWLARADSEGGFPLFLGVCVCFSSVWVGSVLIDSGCAEW